jgi:hypothetical protein
VQWQNHSPTKNPTKKLPFIFLLRRCHQPTFQFFHSWNFN